MTQIFIIFSLLFIDEAEYILRARQSFQNSVARNQRKEDFRQTAEGKRKEIEEYQQRQFRIQRDQFYKQQDYYPIYVYPQRNSYYWYGRTR